MWYRHIQTWWVRIVNEFPPPTTLPGRWRNVGKGRVDEVVADPAYFVKRGREKGRIRDDLHRLVSNEVL